MTKAARMKDKRNSKEAIVNHVATSTCPTCGSSKRTAYNNSTYQELSGVDHAGNTYTGVWWRYCRCEDCGQNRVDKSFDYSAIRKQTG
jgi:hypothetical protein